jgi:hypothetical protein
LYGAKEHGSPKYPPRTRRNIKDADATFLFATNTDSPGTKLACTHAYEIGRPSVVIKVVPGPMTPERPHACAAWLIERRIKVLNVGGNRESKAPGIAAWTENYLATVLRLIQEETA